MIIYVKSVNPVDSLILASNIRGNLRQSFTSGDVGRIRSTTLMLNAINMMGNIVYCDFIPLKMSYT